MDIEARIQEQRTNEAIKKNYMGMEGKIYRIAKYLGFEIVKDSEPSEHFDFDSIYEDTADESIPYLDDSIVSHTIGYSYSGLNSGYDIEVFANDYEQKIKMYYKGILVYSEEGGILLSFIPDKIWENPVEELYKNVEAKIKSKIEKIKKQEEQAVQKLAQEETNRLRSKWGNII